MSVDIHAQSSFGSSPSYHPFNESHCWRASKKGDWIY